MSFTRPPKSTKYLGITLTKDIQELFTGNNKTETLKTPISGGIFHVHGSEDANSLF